MSINDVVEKYGQYADSINSYGIADSGRISSLTLTCDNVEISLMDLSNSMCSSGDFDALGNLILTETDKDIKLSVNRILWTDEKIIGLRGIQIGDSLDSVKSKFLDKSSKYNDGSTRIYSDEDFPELDFVEAPLAWYIDYGENGDNIFLDGINTDLWLRYATGYFGDCAEFYFKDGVLVAMSQEQYVTSEP